MTSRASIRFLRRGEIVELHDVPPMRTVLDYLRLEERSRGTKEGCNEGDCGACTVALGSLRDGRLVYEPVNACILLVGQLDGKELVSVDDLSTDGQLHPVQQALVDSHGSQCGFCTPGFVMSLFTLYQSGKAPTREEIATHIAGNLCRCTGYRPIIDAGLAACTGQATDRWAEGRRRRRSTARKRSMTARTSSSARPTASSQGLQRPKRWRGSRRSIPMPPSSPAQPTSGCGSPSRCASCRRSSSPAG